MAKRNMLTMEHVNQMMSKEIVIGLHTDHNGLVKCIYTPEKKLYEVIKNNESVFVTGDVHEALDFYNDL